MKRVLWISAGATVCVGLGLAAILCVNAWRQLEALEASGRLALEDVATTGAPSEIYSRPLALRRGKQLGSDTLESHLGAIRYRVITEGTPAPGEYLREDAGWTIAARAFEHEGGDDPGGIVRVALSKSGRVQSVRDAEGKRVRERWIEPAVIGAFYGDDARERRRIRLAALPDHVAGAVLAIEDQRFHEHRGLDPTRIVGALVANMRAGRVVQGGSTLTQQLVKNLYLTRERTLLRKLEEVPLALLLESRHTKEELLETYLNEVYLGQAGRVAIHGFGAAARHFFGKDATELAAHESALLAGMLRGPTLYAPRRRPERARERRDVVLSRMIEVGALDAEAGAAAQAQPLGVLPPRRVPNSSRYFVDSLKPRLRERFTPDELESGGLRVYTSLDLRLQQIAELAVSSGLEQLEERTPTLQRDGQDLQAALVAVSPRSGEILAMVGGRRYGATQFNRAVDAKRQPGSVFKPVAALAALTPRGSEPPDYTLATVIEDEPLAIPTPEGDWEPGNHDREFRGMVTLRQALEHSLNVPMIRLGMEIGPRRVVRAARRLGIRSRLRGVPSLVLGTSEVSLLEMTRAYGVLAAEGYLAESRDILAVQDPSGERLLEHPAKGQHMVPPAHVHLVTSALEGVINRGTGYGVRARGFSGPVAGKTGTTDEYRDAWFIGYTRDLAVGVWVGFDDGTTLRNSGSRAALPIFSEFLNPALGRSGGRGFRVPMGVERTAIVAAEGHPSGLACAGEAEEYFLSNTGPIESCRGWSLFADGPRTRPIIQTDWPEEEPGPDVAAGPADEPGPPGEVQVQERRERGRFRIWPWGNPFRRD